MQYCSSTAAAQTPVLGLTRRSGERALSTSLARWRPRAAFFKEGVRLLQGYANFTVGGAVSCTPRRVRFGVREGIAAMLDALGMRACVGVPPPAVHPNVIWLGMLHMLVKFARGLLNIAQSFVCPLAHYPCATQGPHIRSVVAPRG